MILLPRRTTLPACIDVLGLPVRRLTRQSLIETVAARAATGLPTRLAYLNAHTFNLGTRSVSLRRFLAEADLLYADGMSIVWTSKLFGPGLPERLSLSTFIVDLMQTLADRKIAVFLVGGAPGTTDAAAEKLRQSVPNLRIVGTADGFADTQNADQLVRRINAAEPDVLLLGMGTPLQEQWLAQHGPNLDVPVQWTVGALFDLLAGKEPHAPGWMCRAGLQWIFRLAVDPVGKWRRYVVGNPTFLGRVLIDVFSRWARRWLTKPALRETERI